MEEEIPITYELKFTYLTGEHKGDYDFYDWLMSYLEDEQIQSKWQDGLDYDTFLQTLTRSQQYWVKDKLMNVEIRPGDVFAVSNVLREKQDENLRF